jgi:2,3-bisphosphoglycerate-dependent phosphoglycerate mutase
MVRHGQSQWNLENRFTGWTDVDITDKGREEALTAGQLIKKTGISFDEAFTSFQTRAIRTLWISLDEMDCMWLPQTTAWQLNERHYGALQGLNKAETIEKHGADQVHIWRRSYDIPPPALEEDDPRHPKHDPRYATIPPENLVGTESLKTTLERVLPFWEANIFPKLKAGKNLIISAHGNSLRALCKHLLNISDEDITSLEIPTGNPLLFDFDDDMNVTACRYLNQERATALPSL